MGRLFVGNHGGSGHLYTCRVCDAYLTSHSELSSPNFTGATGPALLFRKVWNVEHGKTEERRMTTGWHIVRDVICIFCKSRVGWMYEMAYEPSQTYKEGQFILECELISRQNAIEDPLGADKIDPNTPPVFPMECPRNRNSHSGSSSSRSSSESSDSSTTNLLSVLTFR